MAVFRIEKTKDFTVMSNHHLRNTDLSLKAKGLLSVILSLPETWDYSLEGLARICKEGISAVRTGLDELINAGYVERRRLRNEKGQLNDMEYIIHEQPVNPSAKDSPVSDKPTSEKPMLENLMLDNQTLENPMSENQRQLNTNISNTDKLNTDIIKYQSIKDAHEANSGGNSDNQSGWIDRYNKINAEVKEQIDYEALTHTNNAELVNDIVSVMTEVLLVDTPYYNIEGKEIPTELVRINYRKITYGRLETFLLDFSRLYDKIHNPKKYLITALYNIASTAETSITNRVQSDMRGQF